MDDKQLKSGHATSRRSGWLMLAAAWVVGMIVLTQFFADGEAEKINPNRGPETRVVDGVKEVILKPNRLGHYVTSGYINNQPVNFLLDTGATEVAIPANLAQKLQLQKGPSYIVSTANGNTKVYSTKVNSLKIGDIILTNVNASINPSMQGPVLLGMNVLRQINFSQQGDRLVLSQH
jgi:aspartyl protease family protein